MRLAESAVEFRPDTHQYWLGDRRLRGYTSTIGKWMYPDTYADVPQAVLDRAAERGTLIHGLIDLVDSLGSACDTREVREYVRLREERGLVPLRHEYIVSDGKDFASAVDIVFADGSIADVKTTSKLHLPEVTLQLSVYAYWLERQNRGVRVPAAYCVWLPRERYGECEMVEVPRISARVVGGMIRAYLAGESNARWLAAVTPRTPAPFRRFARRYSVLQGRLAELRRQEAQVKQRLLEAFAAMGCKAYRDDRISITRVLPHESVSVDAEKLRTAYPEVYRDCARRSLTRESIRITLRDGKN